MSYILDALKKADAERERGLTPVPGLHAQPAPVVEAPGDRTERPVGWALWVVAALLGVIAAMLGWRWLGAPGEASAPPDQTFSHVAPAMAPPAARPPAEMASVAAPSVRADGARAAPRLAPSSASREEPRLPGARPSAALAPPAGARVPAASASTASSASTTLYTLETLPDAVRRDLPPMAFSGAMHSDNPAQRMLFINGQVFREGDQPQPDLVLEEIRLKSAVFRFRGLRFRVAY